MIEQLKQVHFEKMNDKYENRLIDLVKNVLNSKTSKPSQEEGKNFI